MTRDDEIVLLSESERESTDKYVLLYDLRFDKEKWKEKKKGYNNRRAWSLGKKKGFKYAKIVGGRISRYDFWCWCCCGWYVLTNYYFLLKITKN